jgi:hypothetical protein
MWGPTKKSDAAELRCVVRAELRLAGTITQGRVREFLDRKGMRIVLPAR